MLAKDEEIEQQVKDMLVAKIIRSLKQSYYLQVHLTPKWRICKDYEDLTSRWLKKLANATYSPNVAESERKDTACIR